MTKKTKQSAGRRQRSSADRLDVLFLLRPGRVPEDLASRDLPSRLRELYEDLVLHLGNLSERCRQQDSHRERKHAVGLRLSMRLLERPRRWTQEEEQRLFDELESRAAPVFLGSDEQPPPIDLPFARVELRLDLNPAAFGPEPDRDTRAAGIRPRVGGGGGADQTHEAGPVAELAKIDYIEDHDKDKTHHEEEPLPSPAEQLKADLQRRLRRLILPADPEKKAETIIELNRSLNQGFWNELRAEAEPLIKSLFEHVPADFEGKRHRASLINALLTSLDRGIEIHDQHGRPHLCSAHAVRGRSSDAQGYLRLIERTRQGSSQRSFAVPSPEHVEIVEASYRERGGQEGTPRGSRTR
jgi:hypothetical protein